MVDLNLEEITYVQSNPNTTLPEHRAKCLKDLIIQPLFKETYPSVYTLKRICRYIGMHLEGVYQYFATTLTTVAVLEGKKKLTLSSKKRVFLIQFCLSSQGVACC